MNHYRAKIKQKSNLVSQAEFARILGVTPQTVQEFKSDGRLILEYGAKRDKVYVNESIANLNKTMQLNGVFRNRRKETEKPEETQKTFEELKGDVGATQLDLETDDADLLFKNSKALKEKALAMQAAAEHEKFIGSLVEKAVVEKIIFERGRQFRDGAMSCSRRIAPDIVGKESIQEIEAIINREMRLMLEQFAKLPVIE